MYSTSSTSLPMSLDYHQQRMEKRQKNRARNRLLSVEKDTNSFVIPLLYNKNIPVIANARCGSWYWPKTTTAVSYFKSMDGHDGVHDFSLKRLNLHIIKILASKGCVAILDSSRRRVIPDSLSKTIPLWATVMNRIALQWKDHETTTHTQWDVNLYTPDSVSREEHAAIESVLESRVRMVLQSGVILEKDLLRHLPKPIRCIWVTPDLEFSWKLVDNMQHDNFVIVCVSCSTLSKDEASLYSPGAADDEEAWARGLTPPLFWKYRHQILDEAHDEDDTDYAIDRIVQSFKADEIDSKANAHAVGNTQIFIGTRRTGKPPDCWNKFDAILNVTTESYEGMATPPVNKYYLQLPVSEGKRDRTELERWMTVGIVFILMHGMQDRRVLVHCAQGKDRSVALVMAFLAIFCNTEENPCSIKYNKETMNAILSDLVGSHDVCEHSSDETFRESTIDRLKGRPGRDLLFHTYKNSTGNPIFVNKERLRIVLQVITQFRGEAAPTRHTMQKLNRYFMSLEYE